MAMMRLVIARWRGDLETVLDARLAVEPALAAQPVSERALSDDVRAVALENLGVAELWSGRFDDARGHLEQARALSRRLQRPWLEIADLSHLAIVEPLTGQPLSAGLERAEQALSIADEHGWGEDPAIVTGLAAGAMILLWLGRLDECEDWLARAERVLQPGGEPTTELVVHHARGLLRLGQDRYPEALEAFRAAERMQARLAGAHVVSVDLLGRLLQTQIAMGDLEPVRAALADAPAEERNGAEMRITAALLHLAEDDPQRAIEVLAPVIERTVEAFHPVCPAIEASLYDAVAHERLGNRRGAEESLERALDLAEAEGIVLPFILAPVQALLEHHPRHRTTHAALLRTTLGVRAGTSARARSEPAPLRETLSEAELRVLRYLPSNLKAPEIAAELFVSNNTVRTHLRHIYAKLDAHDRNEAVARARELGLLAPPLSSR
jgi:LuxR family maltose regulon positive regulatory protein